MSNTRIGRNLFFLGFLILWCFIPTLIYSAQQTSSSPAIVKSVKAPSGLKQAPFLIRGTVTVVYPSQPNGPGVKDVEVSLQQVSETGQVVSTERKMTDIAGHYAFMGLPENKGKRYKIVPKKPQTCCNGCCSWAPEEKAFTLQNSITADFKLYMPSPDSAISLGKIDAHVDTYADYYRTILYEFDVKNKGTLPSAESLFNLSFAQPCCPENCTKEQKVPIIQGQGSTKVALATSWNAGARGCPFTATVSPQQGEVKTDDNKLTGTSPKVQFSLIKITQDANNIYIRNKGTSSATIKVTWQCLDNASCTGCICPPLVPTNASAPAFPKIKSTGKLEKEASLGPNQEWVYPIPVRLPEGGSTGGELSWSLWLNIEDNFGYVSVNFK